MSPSEAMALPEPHPEGYRMRIEEVAALIKALRKRLELTQEQFAQKVGVTYGTVNNWENGKRMPLPFLLRRLIEMRDELDAQNRSPARRKARG